MQDLHAENYNTLQRNVQRRLDREIYIMVMDQKTQYY